MEVRVQGKKVFFTSLLSHFGSNVAELSSDCRMFVTPRIWQRDCLS